MYQALYRKWRPRTFEDVVGQEQVTETLKNQVANDRLSHAYLFVGTRGTGKTSCAKILARAVNCENPQNGNPCNQCKSCRGIEDGSIMDVLEIDAASNNGVDNVRALRDEAIYSPAVVKRRVYIIDEVHMLSGSAFNALLKILEEPPAHLLFILATTELNKVPATILSRCQRHSFKRIDPESLAKRISFVAGQENLTLDEPAAALLARLADGSLRDGLSLLDQCSGNSQITVETVLSAMGLAGNMAVAQLLDQISQNRTADALDIFGRLWNDGKAPGTLLTEMSTLLRDILMTKVAKKGGAALLSGAFDENTLNTFAAKMTSEELISNIDSIQTAVGALRDGRDPKVSAELCIIGLCEPDLGEDLAHLRTRIAKLEELASNPMRAQQSPAKQMQQCNLRTDEAKPENEQDDDRPPFELYEETEVSESDNIRQEISKQDIIPADEGFAEPYEEKPQSNKIPENDKVSAETAQPMTDGTDSCAKVLTELKAVLAPAMWANVKDAELELKGGFIVISVDSSFKKIQLEGSQTQELIRSAIQKAQGNPLPFKIIEAKPKASGDSGKLEGLSKFGNVKFE